jgi:hypothetical protein
MHLNEVEQNTDVFSKQVSLFKMEQRMTQNQTNKSNSKLTYCGRAAVMNSAFTRALCR